MNEKLALLFDRYLVNELSHDEKLNFEEKLKNNPDFKEQFNLHKQFNVFLENRFSEEREDFKSSLEKQGNSFTNLQSTEKTVKVFKIKPWHYSIAASFLLLIGFYFFTFNNTVSYNDYAFSNTISLIERGDDNLLLKNAEEAFNEKKYDKAIVYFNKILKTDTINSQLIFYKGIALVETNKFKAADLVFLKLQQGNSVYKNKSIFYQALSKLKQKDVKAVKQLLTTLPENAEDYKKAQEILKKLNLVHDKNIIH